MQIHQIVKDTIKQHKEKIELIQWAIISGVSSLVYSEYIRRIKQKNSPVRAVLVPEIKRVQEFLNPDNEGFIEMLSDRMIDMIANHELIKKYSDAPELVLFNEDNIEVMKTLFDLYITPNIVTRIPESILLKFGLNDPNQQLIRQDRNIQLFDGRFIDNRQFDFVIDQTVLQLLVLLPTMKRSIEIPEDNSRIFMSKDEILTIGHENAICPIHFNKDIISNKSIIELLSFVTNTNIGIMDNKEVKMQLKNGIAEYHIRTNVFNQVGVIKLEGIQLPKEDKYDTFLKEKAAGRNN